MSASTIQRLTREWNQELATFQQRDLSQVDYIYLWADGVHFNIRLEHVGAQIIHPGHGSAARPGQRRLSAAKGAHCVVRAGVGKTHLADALGHQACRQGHRVEFIKTSRLLSDLGGGHADGTWDGRLRRYLLPSLLIIGY